MGLYFQLPFTYTGADFYALCTDAMLNGIKRKIAELDAAYGADCALAPARQSADTHGLLPSRQRRRRVPARAAVEHASRPTLTMERYLAGLPTEQLAVQLTLPDFLQAARQLVPSVSAAELAHYRRVQQSFATPSKPKATGDPADHTAAGASEEAPDKAKAAPDQGPPQGATNGNGHEPAPTDEGAGKGKKKGKGKGKGKARAADLDDDL